MILKKKGVKDAECTGDGTGYSLTISKHYASVAQKLKDKSNKGSGKTSKKRKDKKMRFTFSFRLMDLKTRMYIGFGSRSLSYYWLKRQMMNEWTGAALPEEVLPFPSSGLETNPLYISPTMWRGGPKSHTDGKELDTYWRLRSDVQDRWYRKYLPIWIAGLYLYI